LTRSDGRTLFPKVRFRPHASPESSSDLVLTYPSLILAAVHPYFERLIKPLLERQPVQDDGQSDMTEELDGEIKEVSAK
jgi:hypothetical protein